MRMLRKTGLAIFIFVSVLQLFLTPISVFSQENDFQNVQPKQQEYYRARVINIELGSDKACAQCEPVRLIDAVILDGNKRDTRVKIEYQPVSSTLTTTPVGVGDSIVVMEAQDDSGLQYYLVEQYRLDWLLFVVLFFAFLVILLSRWKGLFSILGLFTGLGVIIWYIVPQIVQGVNPIFVSLVGVLFTAVISLYLAHGFNKRTTLALLSTFVTMTLAVVLSYVFVNLTKLTGSGSESSLFIQTSPTGNKIDLKGLLLGAILIGTLGVLDDITTAQTAVVEELKKLKPDLQMKELYSRSISVGKEHIASLVNTLAFAYIGNSLPLFIAFWVTNGKPWWVILNSEPLVEEFVQSLVASSVLVLAVPIATFVAAYTYGKMNASQVEQLTPNNQAHSHAGHSH